jgi:hypothetical protein
MPFMQGLYIDNLGKDIQILNTFREKILHIRNVQARSARGRAGRSSPREALK